MEENAQYHIRCKQGDIERYCLLPGDPDRVPLIAEDWDEGHFVANYREHRTYSGTVGGVSYGTPVGDTEDFYRTIPIQPTAYGQGLTFLMLTEALRL